LANENPQAADDFVDALYDAFNKLAENPMLGHVREDLTPTILLDFGRSNGIMEAIDEHSIVQEPHAQL
jgi:plasmid stabilization system protein ParE